LPFPGDKGLKPWARIKVCHYHVLILSASDIFMKFFKSINNAKNVCLPARAFRAGAHLVGRLPN
jgi:hypothetical protein